MPTDKFDDIPQIMIEKDDMDSFHRSRAKPTKTDHQEEEANHAQQKPSASGPSWLSLIVLLLLIGAGAGYWSNQQYIAAQQAQGRIAELERRLSATGEDMDQSAAALQIKVTELTARTQELWDQMDRLWASAWRRNQSDIAALDKTLQKLKTNNDQSGLSLSNDVTANDARIDVLNEQLVNQSSLIKQLDEQLSQASSADNNVEQQLASLREKLISTALANNTLTNKLDDLARRLTAAEQVAKQSKPALVNTP
jgi:predicted RNase H-like nuclease (RuvC/YqgF family)